LGKMVEEQGAAFVREMVGSGSEVATHGYTHDMRELGDGEHIYAGHYGLDANAANVRRGVEALRAAGAPAVRGMRLPYAHFNEFSYDAMEQASLEWASNVGIDDYIVEGQGFGGQPFRITLGDKTYALVEIPLDTQTFDWPIWIATRESNGAMVDAVAKYCRLHSIAFERSPAGAVGVWRRRVEDTIADEGVFTLLCHPINLAVSSENWGDPVDEFLLPVIDMLGEYHRGGLAWVCTCGQMADFYLQAMGETL
ncbi:MAG: hypothetical protein J7M14_03015, partial [Planctomycetes bacterium]|nr:hypothetical protein [Planctomycetota bacterium]